MNRAIDAFLDEVWGGVMQEPFDGYMRMRGQKRYEWINQLMLAKRVRNHNAQGSLHLIGTPQIGLELAPRQQQFFRPRVIPRTGFGQL